MRRLLALKVNIVMIATATLATGPVGQTSSTARKSRPPMVQEAPNITDQKHTGSVAGRVVNESGKPVVSAKIVLKDSVTQELTSASADRDGKYTFGKLFPGNYSVQAEKEDSKSPSRDVRVVNDDVTNADLVITAKQPK
jgi:hypothetical protein